MFCEKCGGKGSDGARFCASCGAEFIQNESTIEADKVQTNTSNVIVPQKRKKAERITLIVKNALITTLAVILFVFSFFPIMSVESEYLDVEVKINFSAIDNMSIFAASFSNYSDLKETPAYEDIVSLSERLQGRISELDGISEKQVVKMFEKEINRISILTAKAVLMTEGSKASLSAVFTAIISCLYMVLTTAFLVVSILNLLGTFGVIKVGSRFNWWINTLFAATPIFLLLLFYVMGITYSAMSSVIAMSGFAFATIILFVAMLIYCVVQRMIFTKNKNIKVFVMRCVVAALAVVVMISSLIPISYGAVLDKKTAIRVGSFNAYSTINDETLEEANGVYNKDEKAEITSIYNTLSKMTQNEIGSTEGEAVNNQLILSVVKCWYYKGTIMLFSLIPIAYILALVVSALIMWHCIKFLITGSECKAQYLVFRIVMTVIAALVLALAISFTTMINFATRDLIGAGYSVNIGALAILMAIFTTIIMSMPTFKCIDIVEENKDDNLTNERNDEKADTPEENDPSITISSVVSEIKALKELCDIGAISEEEFSAKKAQLLGL